MLCLTEAYRHMNYLTDLLDTAEQYLCTKDFITTTVEHHKRTSANPEAQDEDITVQKPTNIPDITVNEVVDFSQKLLDEMEKLNKAINKAKAQCEFDIDAEQQSNIKRRQLVAVLNKMATYTSNETQSTGTACKFNNEGNQVRYTYDVTKVQTIDFDRKAIKAISKRLRKHHDDVSMEIETMNINKIVDYTPVIDIDDEFEDAVSALLTN